MFIFKKRARGVEGSKDEMNRGKAVSEDGDGILGVVGRMDEGGSDTREFSSGNGVGLMTATGVDKVEFERQVLGLVSFIKRSTSPSGQYAIVP